MSDPAPSRRWFRWSLRTLFVVVTALCVWLGYAVHWRTQRRELLACRGISVAGAHIPPPAPLWLLGERGVAQLCIWPGESHDRHCVEAKRLFPEAQIVRGFVFTVPVLH